MRKATLALLIVAAIGGATLMAANIGSTFIGQGCAPGFIGSFHFVNNQTGGAGAGQLSATWDSGDTCQVGAYSVLSNTQHFSCMATGLLTSASTNLPGKLVLSHYTCTDTKEPPPPCDPKKEVCK